MGFPCIRLTYQQHCGVVVPYHRRQFITGNFPDVIIKQIIQYSSNFISTACTLIFISKSRNSVRRQIDISVIFNHIGKDLYPDVYKNDHFVEVTEDVLETIRAAERVEAAYDRRMYRYKAHYSLDCDNGIENAILLKPQTPEMLLEEKQLREQLYAAVMALPEKQAKRIYARYYLGMRVSEIAVAEGVDPSRVRDSIRRGLKQLAKYF